MDVILEAVLWSTFAVVLSQGISLTVMMFLGLPPRKLITTIEDEQNTAVGAVFFIVSLISANYIGVVSSDGFNPTGEAIRDLAWIIGGVILALIYTTVLFILANRIMIPLDGENTYNYIRREIVEEQNASLAFFLGGLAVSPFIATLYQIL